MLQRLDLRGSGTEVASQLPRPVIAGSEPHAIVEKILADVKQDGDRVLLELTAKFDGVSLESVRVPSDELARAAEAIPSELRTAMEVAIERIGNFHRAQLHDPVVTSQDGVRIEAYQRPVQRAGLYVPGGRAEYPSTVLMTAVPAKVAGVDNVVLCVPPSRELGAVSPTVLAAAYLSGVDEVYSVGGAQAIGAMAYGTDTIDAVDVIAGPGNIYVAIAKQQVAGDVGIAAAFAGPSEVVVVADSSATPEYAAIDVILQAEHGPDGLAWLVTWDESVADAVCATGETLLANSPRAEDVRATLAEGGYVALVDNPDAALAVVDAIAPEHLELQCENADQLARRVNNAGAIFCGDLAPASIGDYLAGPSHVLPTYGSARFSSALTVSDFVKDHHIVTVEEQGLKTLGPHVVTLAACEGLDAHAASVQLRLDRLEEKS